MLTLNEKEMEIVASEFGLKVNELKEMIEKGEVELFSSYSRFFYNMHENKSQDELIQMMEEGTTCVDNLTYHTLESGKTAYIF